MQCKWIKVEGKQNNNTTRFFICGLKNKAIDEYECRDCPLFIIDKVEDSDIVNRLFGIFGGNNGD